MARIKTHLLEVKINASATVGTIVPAWEIPILKSLHGADEEGFGSVREVSTDTLEMDISDVSTVYFALKEKYRNKNGEKTVDRYYPQLSDFARAVEAATEPEPKPAKPKGKSAAKKDDALPKDEDADEDEQGEQ